MRTETFPTPRQLAVNVKLPRGDVDVETADVQEATVQLTARRSARATRSSAPRSGSRAAPTTTS